MRVLPGLANPSLCWMVWSRSAWTQTCADNIRRMRPDWASHRLGWPHYWSMIPYWTETGFTFTIDGNVWEPIPFTGYPSISEGLAANIYRIEGRQFQIFAFIPKERHTVHSCTCIVLCIQYECVLTPRMAFMRLSSARGDDVSDSPEGLSFEPSKEKALFAIRDMWLSD